MATALGIAKSITNLLGFTVTLISYLKDVRNASADRTRLLYEVSHLETDLKALQDLISDAKPGDPCFTAILNLNVKNGPIARLEACLVKLASKLEKPVTVVGKITTKLTWKFDKTEIAEIFTEIGRLRTSVSFAMQNDHM